MSRTAAWAGWALVLAAALAAGAAAAGQPMPLLAGAAAASGPVAGGAPVSPVPAHEAGAPRGETDLPSDIERLAGGAGTGADGEPPAVSSPARQEDAAAPGGSRLLRALAERSAPESSPVVSGPAAWAAQGCPRALLRRLLAGAAGEVDALAALAIEREVLTLCRERQQIVVSLLEGEARLSEQRASAEPPRVAEAAIPSAPVAPAAHENSEEPASPSPLRAALADAPETDKSEPSLGWFSIIGSAGALRAGITDGSGIWFVREGDRLPGGGAVAAIAGRPPSVRTTGEDGSLPFRARPGGAP